MKAMTALLAAVAAAAFVGLVPFDGADVSDLCPVEILCLEQRDGRIHITADGGSAASGKTVAEALAALDRSVPGRLLLDTVDQMVFTGFLPEPKTLLDCGLRPAVRVFRSPPVEDADRLAVYLSKLDGGMTLGTWYEHPHRELPRLEACEMGLRLPDGRELR